MVVLSLGLRRPPNFARSAAPIGRRMEIGFYRAYASRLIRSAALPASEHAKLRDGFPRRQEFLFEAR